MPYKTVEGKNRWRERYREKQRALNRQYQEREKEKNRHAVEARKKERQAKRDARAHEQETRRMILSVKDAMRAIRRRIMERDGLKECGRCGKIGPADGFIKSRSWRMCRSCHTKYNNDYKKANPDVVKRSRAKAYDRIMNTPPLLVRARIRQSMQKAIARMASGATVKGGKLRYLGCTAADACAYLEQQFKGCMTWSNYGRAWHIDHVHPLAMFDLSQEADRAKAFHYTNMRPLWAKANMRKNAKNTVPIHQPELILAPGAVGSSARPAV